MDPDDKPNMNQLRLISSEQLTKTSRPLGKGAFGIVYAVSQYVCFQILLKKAFKGVLVDFLKSIHLYFMFESSNFMSENEAVTDDIPAV